MQTRMFDYTANIAAVKNSMDPSWLFFLSCSLAVSTMNHNYMKKAQMPGCSLTRPWIV